MSATIKPQSKLSTDKHLGFLYRIMLQAGHIGRKPTKSERDRAMSIIVNGDR